MSDLVEPRDIMTWVTSASDKQTDLFIVHEYASWSIAKTPARNAACSLRA